MVGPGRPDLPGPSHPPFLFPPPTSSCPPSSTSPSPFHPLLFFFFIFGSDGVGRSGREPGSGPPPLEMGTDRRTRQKSCPVRDSETASELAPRPRGLHQCPFQAPRWSSPFHASSGRGFRGRRRGFFTSSSQFPGRECLGEGRNLRGGRPHPPGRGLSGSGPPLPPALPGPPRSRRPAPPGSW